METQNEIITNKVLVRLTGDLIDIEDLKKVLKSGDWNIIKVEDSHYLTSRLIDGLTDKTEIKTKSGHYLGRLNGAASAANYNHKPVTTDSYTRYDEHGKRHIVQSVGPIEFRLPDKNELLEPTNEIGQSIHEQWVEKAERYNNVSDVLFFFNEINWINLYKIYEIIKEDVGNEKKLFELLPISRDEIKNFTQTANSRNAIGEKARHADRKIPVPSKSLTLENAHKTIKTLFEMWMETKH